MTDGILKTVRGEVKAGVRKEKFHTAREKGSTRVARTESQKRVKIGANHGKRHNKKKNKGRGEWNEDAAPGTRR